jgi:hypothetical protein
MMSVEIIGNMPRLPWIVKLNTDLATSWSSTDMQLPAAIRLRPGLVASILKSISKQGFMDINWY